MSEQDEVKARVLLCVTGGIAAYKACEVLRGLQKAGCAVRVAMTADAQRFVGKVTFEALSGAPVLVDLYGHEGDPIPHISYAQWADAALVVPATANVLAKIACGIADDALTSTLLALPAKTPLIVAPAMNVNMWQNPATQANVQALVARGVFVITPDAGRLACGDVGAGKLAEVGRIVTDTLEELCVPVGVWGEKSAAAGDLPGDGEEPVTQDLTGLRILVTAGPTHEAIDPVRYIANASSGKMGYTIAHEAQRRGAEVVLVSGPTSLATPAGVERVDVVSAAEMHEACLDAFDECDAAICAAAVADYTPAQTADHKLKKANDHLDSIRLVETADILADLSRRKGTRVVVGFAAETNDLERNAYDKLMRKGCDLIVANDVSRRDSTFGADTDRVEFVSPEGIEQLPTLPKSEVASAILDRVARLADREAAAEREGLDKTVLLPALRLAQDAGEDQG